MIDQELTKEFKESIRSFFKEIGCLETSMEIDEDVETFQDLLYVLENNSSEITSAIDHECDECQKKENKIDELEERVSNMKDSDAELSDLKEQFENSFYPETLTDVYKLQSFIENKDNYSISEFEEIFKK